MTIPFTNNNKYCTNIYKITIFTKYGNVSEIFRELHVFITGTTKFVPGNCNCK